MALEVTTDLQHVARVDFSVDGELAGVARTPPYRIAFDFGTALIARTVTATVWTEGFRAKESASITTAAWSAGEVHHVDVVELPLRVRSSKTLTPSDLRIRENGVEQTIREVRAERPPAHFAFVVDRSLSMGEGKLEAALDAVQLVQKQLRPGDSASLTLFNHQVMRAVRLDGTTALPHDLTSSGGTSLRDALASIDTQQRTYAIVITDGGDRTSALSEDEALRRISGTKTIVNALVFGRSHTRFLDRAATNTGGRVVAVTPASVSGRLRDILAGINSRYLIVYQSQGTARGWRSIDVKARRRGIGLGGARKGYFAE